MGEKEPAAVAEARRAASALNRLVALFCGCAGLGWIPIMFFEPGTALALMAVTVYMAVLLGGTGGLIWQQQRTKWAQDLLRSWERSQADLALQSAMGEPQRDAADVQVPTLMARIREHLAVDARALRAAEEAFARSSGVAD